jgi:hypothetical protein
MIVLTRWTVRQALADVITEKGDDYVYPNAGGTCFYRVGDQPSCVWGHVFDRLGVDPEFVGGFEGRAVRLPLESLGITDGELKDAADAVQQAQDEGAEYGELLSYFDSAFKKEPVFVR